MSWELVPDAPHAGAEDSLEEAFLRREANIRLRTLLAALDDGTREALILRFSARLTLVEIGAVLGKSEDAARKQITRALHALKEHYHDDRR